MLKEMRMQWIFVLCTHLLLCHKYLKYWRALLGWPAAMVRKHSTCTLVSSNLLAANSSSASWEGGQKQHHIHTHILWVRNKTRAFSLISKMIKHTPVAENDERGLRPKLTMYTYYKHLINHKNKLRLQVASVSSSQHSWKPAFLLFWRTQDFCPM